MRISDSQTNQESLASLGAEAVALLCSGSIAELASRFGYALAHGRDTEAAIREDLAACLSEVHAAHLAPSGKESPTVTYFQPNGSNLVAQVGCDIPTENGNILLAELIVTSEGCATFVTLEQLSVGA